MGFGKMIGKKKKAPRLRCPGISPAANIRTLCAWCASTPIFEWRMRTRIQNAKHFEREDERMGHRRMKKAPRLRCPGILPTANIRTLCAWCASTPIFERRMRTRIQNTKRFGQEDERMGHQRMKKAPRLRCFILW